MTQNAFDNQARDLVMQKRLETEYKVKITENDELFYKESCNGSNTHMCSPTVPIAWSTTVKIARSKKKIKKKVDFNHQIISVKNLQEKFLQQSNDSQLGVEKMVRMIQTLLFLFAHPSMIRLLLLQKHVARTIFLYLKRILRRTSFQKLKSDRKGDW